MSTTDLDRKFDEGVEEVLSSFDVAAATRPNRRVRRVNVDFPDWVVEALDREALRLGVTRQSIIKVWIAERIEKSGSQR
jgi:hypothetical protein